MFEVWEDRGGMGALPGGFASVFGHQAPRFSTPVGGGSLVQAMRQGLKLSTYNPYHAVDKWGRPVPGVSSGAQAIAPPLQASGYHPALMAADPFNCPEGTYLNRYHGCLPDPYFDGGLPSTTIDGLSGITDTLKGWWTAHPMYVVAGAAAAYFFLFSKHRRR